MPWPGWQVLEARPVPVPSPDRSLDLQVQSIADAAELGALADLQHQLDAASPDSTQLIYTGRAGDSIAVPPWPNSAVHKTASSTVATRLATSRPAGSTNGGSSSRSSSGVATSWVSAAEVLRLMQDYSHALSSLSADLTRARQRAEEVTALKLTLEKLRTQQQQQMHPQEPAAKHPLLLGQQQQQ